jgi:alkylhydroperoxidase family enzyme
MKMEKNANAPRLTPFNVEEMPHEWHDIIGRLPGSGLKGRYAPVNVLGTLMHEPMFMGEFLDYWVTSKLKMSFTVREQELIILRMAVHYNCDYVWKHHVPVAQEFGVTDEELNAVKAIPLPGLFSSREAALLILTDEMAIRRDVGDDTWNHLKAELTDREIVDLIHIVSQYVFFTLANKILRVEIEPGLKEISSL